MKMKKNGKKMAGMKKKMGKATTPKTKSAMTKMRADKKAMKSRSIHAVVVLV